MPPTAKQTLGGNHRYLYMLCEALAENIELHLVCDNKPEYSTLIADLSELGVSIHYAPFCDDPEQAARALDAAIESVEPLLIHVNGHQSWLQPALERSNRLPSAKRKLYTMHLPIAGLLAAKASGWKQLIPGTWSHDTIKTDKSFLNLFDDVLSVSVRYGEELVTENFIRDSQLTCIPNAVDTDYFQHEETTRSKTFTIGGAGNLIPQKRFDLLLKSFARVLREHPDSRLLIAGEGQDRSSLEEQSVAAGIRERVAFVGYQSDMASFYNGLDLFVLSSDYEAAPYVVLEAASCGTPSVATEVGDIRHWFTGPLAALVAPTGDSEAIAERIIKLLPDRERLETLGRSARRLVEERHSKQAWATQMSAFMARELERAGGVRLEH